MKKLHLVLAAVSLIAAMSAVFAPASSASEEKVGSVLAIKGTAMVRRSGDWDPVRLKVKDPVYLKDDLTTGDGSKLKILMNDESILTLGQNSRLAVSEYKFLPETKERRSIFKLAKGALRSLVSKLSAAGNVFEVHTPTAVAGARGTINLVQILPGEDAGDGWDGEDTPDTLRTFVVGVEDNTEVNNIDPDVHGSETLTGNMGSYIALGQAPTPPFNVPNEILTPLMTGTDISNDEEGVTGDDAGDGGSGGGSDGDGGDAGGGDNTGDTGGGLSEAKEQMNSTIEEQSGEVLGNYSEQLVGDALALLSSPPDSGGNGGDNNAGTGDTGTNTGDAGTETPDVDLTISDTVGDSVTNLTGLFADNFESGELTGWNSANAMVVPAIPELGPLDGSGFMAAIHNSGESITTGFMELVFNLSQSGLTNISFQYNFLTDEAIGEYYYRDYFLATLTGPDGATTQLAFADTTSQLNYLTDTGTLPFYYNAETGWITVNTDLQLDAGDNILNFLVRDVGDTIVDSGVLIDNVVIGGNPAEIPPIDILAVE